MQLLLEFRVAYLLQDFGVSGTVNLEYFFAVRADDFIHKNLFFASLEV